MKSRRIINHVKSCPVELTPAKWNEIKSCQVTLTRPNSTWARARQVKHSSAQVNSIQAKPCQVKSSPQKTSLLKLIKSHVKLARQKPKPTSNQNQHQNRIRSCKQSRFVSANYYYCVPVHHSRCQLRQCPFGYSWNLWIFGPNCSWAKSVRARSPQVKSTRIASIYLKSRQVRWSPSQVKSHEFQWSDMK